MTESMVGAHAKGTVYKDNLLTTIAAANNAVAEYGRENVINGSGGVMQSEEGHLICLTSVQEELYKVPASEMIAYAPIGGTHEFQDAAIQHTFGHYRPKGHIAAVATPGGAGAVSAVIWNYSDSGDSALTHDWYWTPYATMCQESGRTLETFALFNQDNRFNLAAFSEKVAAILQRQDRLVIILNTPGNNPTGFSLSDSEWDSVIAIVKENANKSNKRITLLIDIAYIDFTYDPAAVRLFMTKFDSLPDTVFVAYAFSMSKSFTGYGQRVGAAIGVSKNKAIIDEFVNVMHTTGRTRWSNCNRGFMQVMANLYADAAKVEKLDAERCANVQLIAERANLFQQEAKEIGLKVLPYYGGFFVTVPVENSPAICEVLAKQNIFLVALGKGIRIAVCSVPLKQIKGLAAKVLAAIKLVE